MRTTIALSALLLPMLATMPAGAHEPVAAYVARYDWPTSVVVPHVGGAVLFGVGQPLCAGSEMEQQVNDELPNSACFPYAGHEQDAYFLFARDEAWTAVSFVAAVDLNGDGCISNSCNGVPNSADYRANGCGMTLTDRLPTPDPGVERTLIVLIRVLFVDTTTTAVCGGSQGTISAVV